jgi:hypothetical protein
VTTFPFDEVPRAIEALRAGRAEGSIVVEVQRQKT